MTGLRVAADAAGISMWSADIFGQPGNERVREFLTRVFSVRAIQSVELRPAMSFGRVRYGAVSSSPSQLCRDVSRALRTALDAPALRADVGAVHLPPSAAAYVTRIDDALTTFRLRGRAEDALQLAHPRLRNQRDLAFRLEEELSALLGVDEVHASALTGRLSIRFDRRQLTAARLVRSLERAWPRALEGAARRPSRKRLATSIGLFGLAFTGQYVVPAARPVALAAVTLYSSPNVVGAIKQLSRGEIGLYVMYATGLGFMLASGMPFASSLFAVLGQTWPELTHRSFVRSQRRLFAAQRRRPQWARLPSRDGAEVEVSVDDLDNGDRIVVHHGEIIPVDGVVEAGFASVIVDAAFAAEQAEERSAGDVVLAGALVRDGSLTIRVERTGEQTLASRLDALLPHAAFVGLPSSAEAERIANRNAKPALALAAVSFIATRTARVSQAVIRPDYATAPRLSAQLSALRGVAAAWQRGAVFRSAAALERVASSDVYVIDDSAALDRRRIEVTAVRSVDGVSEAAVLEYAWAALASSRSERARALASYAAQRGLPAPSATLVTHAAGAIRYRDALTRAIEVASPRYCAATGVELPAGWSGARSVEPTATRTLWVLRDGRAIGAVSFARSGELVGKDVIAALKLQNRRARLLYLSRRGEQATHALARTLGVEYAFGDLSPAAKSDVIRELGRPALWIGDASEPDASRALSASAVSISTAPLTAAGLGADAADVLLPLRGLEGVPEVIAIARAHADRLARDYRALYAVNLLGVAGALGSRFGSLHAGLLSHFGTAVIYSQHARALDRMVASADAQRARRKG